MKQKQKYYAKINIESYFIFLNIYDVIVLKLF